MCGTLAWTTKQLVVANLISPKTRTKVVGLDLQGFSGRGWTIWHGHQIETISYKSPGKVTNGCVNVEPSRELSIDLIGSCHCPIYGASGASGGPRVNKKIARPDFLLTKVVGSIAYLSSSILHICSLEHRLVKPSILYLGSLRSQKGKSERKTMSIFCFDLLVFIINSVG